jgi:hypothetical protein
MWTSTPPVDHHYYDTTGMFEDACGTTDLRSPRRGERVGEMVVRNVTGHCNAIGVIVRRVSQDGEAIALSLVPWLVEGFFGFGINHA